MGFYPGQEVLWKTTVGGYQWPIKVPARVVHATKKRVVIEARTKRGTWEQRCVTHDHVIPCPTPAQVLNELMVLG